MSPDENSEPHYSITFERNFHDELVIDYELVEATNNKEHEFNEQDYTELQMLKCPTFNPIQNVQLLHRRYATLLHEYQLEIVILLSLFQLFFTDKQLNSMVVNTNIYEQVKGVHKISAVEDLWNSDEKKATHEIKRFMSMVTDTNILSKEFRNNLAWDLIKDTLDNKLSQNEIPSQASSKGKRVAHVTKNFELPLTRLLDGDHLVEWREKREACIYCYYLLLRGEKAINYDNPYRAICSVLNVKHYCVALKPDRIVLGTSILKNYEDFYINCLNLD
ncbi:9816_t:CDS:2 [Cetraspora pellucida]|uniref:9816_t:CDS:1 n=1 Tax=Cetraspora pellucida TaxID=1433469 RepID=A0ACA9K3T1_9GLOM|nr:9816_t:CDS:2 [Cetraspora pellucida]